MSDRVAEQISFFRSHIKNRRFDEGTLRILESVLVSKNVKSLLEVRSCLQEFLRSECLTVIREIAEDTVEQKLSILEFFVRAFALAGDIESCLSLRYEALTLRQLKSTSYWCLQVSYKEWLTFAEHSLDKGFYAIARKACENALSCLQVNDVADPETDDFFENKQVTEKIKRLKDVALASDALRSVQAQAVAYLKNRTNEEGVKNPSLGTETQCSASTLFRNGIKKRNARKLHGSGNQQQNHGKSLC